jgi:hypothetical protein
VDNMVQQKPQGTSPSVRNNPVARRPQPDPQGVVMPTAGALSACFTLG